MVYILGVNHSVQSNKEAEQTKRFVSFLRTNIEDLDIAFVGEEWNQDASRLWGIQRTTVEDLITEMCSEGRQVVTKYCDPSLVEQKALGILSQAEIAAAIGSHLKKDIDKEQAKDHPKREQYWLEQLTPHLAGHCIFICGSSHINGRSDYRSEGFDTLLAAQGIEYTVFHELFDEDVYTQLLPNPIPVSNGSSVSPSIPHEPSHPSPAQEH